MTGILESFTVIVNLIKKLLQTYYVKSTIVV